MNEKHAHLLDAIKFYSGVSVQASFKKKKNYSHVSQIKGGIVGLWQSAILFHYTSEADISISNTNTKTTQMIHSTAGKGEMCNLGTITT